MIKPHTCVSHNGILIDRFVAQERLYTGHLTLWLLLLDCLLQTLVCLCAAALQLSSRKRLCRCRCGSAARSAQNAPLQSPPSPCVLSPEPTSCDLTPFTIVTPVLDISTVRAHTKENCPADHSRRQRNPSEVFGGFCPYHARGREPHAAT